MAIIIDPNIASSGLVFSIDAGNARSYSGSGLTVNGLVGGLGGTLVNGVGFTSSNSGAFSFDGSNDHIIVDMTANLRPTSAITQEVWFKLDNSGVSGHFMAHQYGSSWNNSYVMWYVPPNLFTALSLPGWSSTSYAANLNNTSWYHLAQTYNGSIHCQYLNGALVGTTSASGSITYDLTNNKLLIGSDYLTGYNSGLDVVLNGKISTAKIYNRALSASEIKNNFEATRDRYGI